MIIIKNRIPSRASGDHSGMTKGRNTVTPTKVGVQFLEDTRKYWIPASAGMTVVAGMTGLVGLEGSVG
jgi:hypothetical protein